MIPRNFQLDVAAANGRPTRQAVLEHVTSGEFRDRVDPGSARSREGFARKAAAHFSIDGGELAWLDSALLATADEADARVEAQVAAAPAPDAKPSQASLLLELAGKLELVCDRDGIAFARMNDEDCAKVLPLRNRGFRTWLSHQFFRVHAKAPSSRAMQDALAVLEGRAIYEGTERDVCIRCAEQGGRIYVDLCNAAWQAVEIDGSGWRVLDQSPVLFRRAKAMLPLPTPEHGGSIDLLRQHLNIGDDDWPLIVGWLVAALRPTGPYPILAVHGEQGSAKSTACRMLRELVDPNGAPLRCEPREPRDLAIAASNSWVVAMDNISYVKPWLSDALCRLSTGGGFATRALFENDEEQIFEAQRPTIVNGIEELANRSDLLDRSLLVNLPRIDPARRMPERELWSRFQVDRPKILGALFSAVSAAIANLPQTQLPTLPRMADFALWATAAEPALGLAPGQFTNTYSANRASGNDLAVEASPVARAVVDLLDRAPADEWNGAGYWSGTATELLAELDAAVGEKIQRQKSWPANARALSGTLKRMAPNLRELGVEIDFVRRGASGAKVWKLTLGERPGDFATVPSVASVKPDATAF